MLFGIIILVIGIALLLQAMGLLTGGVWSFFWAILFIVIGLKMTMGHKKCICEWFSHEGMTHKHHGCCGHTRENDKENMEEKE